MSRIRSIHPDACDSEKLAELSDAAERLYWRLLTHCDDDGRCDDNLKLIRGKVVPLLDWSLQDLDELLTELHDIGLLVRYVANGRRYVQVGQWDRFQHPRKPQRGKRPPVPPVDNPTGDTGSPIEDTPVRDECATGSDLEGAPVAQGEEGRGEERRPPYGGGGGLGEEGGNRRGGRLAAFTDAPKVDAAVTKFQSNLARVEAQRGVS